MVTAYEIAKTGGKHHGWYLEQVKLSDAELLKGISSFEKQIARHESWIADPTIKIANYSDFDPRRQVALIAGWKQDASRHRESIEIQRRILKERANGQK